MVAVAIRKMSYYFTSGNNYAVNLDYNGCDSITIVIRQFGKNDTSNIGVEEVFTVECKDLSEVSNRLYCWYKSVYQDMTKYETSIMVKTKMIGFYLNNGTNVYVWDLDKTYKSRINLFPNGNIVISTKEITASGHF